MPSTALTRDEARDRARLLSGVSYEVTLDLTGENDRTFASETVVRFASAETGGATFLDFEADRIDEVWLNGSILSQKPIKAGRIALNDLEAENEVRVVARCAFRRDGTGLHRFADPIDGAVYLHTQFEPFDAHKVFACFDQPDLKAPFSLTVFAPQDWECSSNGVATVQAGRREGTRHWTFAPTLPLSTYLTALVAGPFHVVRERHGEIALGLYCRRSLAEHLDTDEMFEITRQGFDFFTEQFDYPYPFGKYDQVFVPEFNAGAMENPGCVTFSESYIFRSKVTDAARRSRANTTLHEMAHMWFGDLVTMRWWDDLWLNESFATYTAYLAAAEATRFTDSWASFASGMKSWAAAQDQLPSTHPISADMVDTDAIRVFFDGITYAKGASVLKQLVHWVGRDAFFGGLRGYFPRHEFGNAELADFLAALEEGSGRDLGDWSKQWLETAGINTLRADLDVDGDRLASVAILQEATPEYPTLRAHRLALGLYDLDGDRLLLRRRVELDVAGARTEVAELAGERTPALLLVNDSDLAYAKVRLDPTSLDTLAGHLGAVHDPLARAICWGATWDMTRDAELPARRFVDLVARHATAETEIGLLQTLLRQAEAAIDVYGDPSRRTELRALLAAQARQAAEAAEPGGDAQLIWVRAYASTADAPADLAFLRGLLDGTDELPGLAVDTDLRWHLLTALAESGAADADAIAAEQRRDPTDIGTRRGATALAARPLAEAKQEAWTALLEDRDLPLAMVRALMSGLYRPGQDELLGSYVDRYPDAAARVWAERDVDVALEMIEGMYPSTIVGQAVVDAADRALAGDLPPPAKRLVSEGRDSTQRALRARAADR
jgi:aminopeptidase N